tara:strand:+ start:232 stop:588 length:357 start_codon:yes stop_codon:yes gene_type:complete
MLLKNTIFLKIIFRILFPVFYSLYPVKNQLDFNNLRKVFISFYISIPSKLIILITLFSIFINIFSFLLKLKFFNFLSQEKKNYILKKIFNSQIFYLWSGIQLLKSHAILIFEAVKKDD